MLTTWLAFSSIGNPLTATGNELRDNAAACSTFLPISGVAMGVVFYLVRMVFQREFDSAVEFTASVYAVPGKPRSLELLAKLKNISNIAAEIESLKYDIINWETKQSILKTSPRSWDLSKPGSPRILTRNTTWQIATIENIDETYGHGPFRLEADCKIGLQPEEQAIRFETLFTIN